VEDHSRRIVVIRHAKAEQGGATDFERQLASRGRADAAALGGWLAGQGVRPDHALVSAATRTRQTWTEVAAAAGWELEPELDEGLYSAGPETALDLLRAAPEHAHTLVLVGHNPTVATLAQLLDDGEGDVAACNDMLMGYPTGAATVLSYAGAWADLTEQSAQVVAFHVGRGG
jgi:phosphohistidine phosphatase